MGKQHDSFIRAIISFSYIRTRKITYGLNSSNWSDARLGTSLLPYAKTVHWSNRRAIHISALWRQVENTFHLTKPPTIVFDTRGEQSFVLCRHILKGQKKVKRKVFSWRVQVSLIFVWLWRQHSRLYCCMSLHSEAPPPPVLDRYLWREGEPLWPTGGNCCFDTHYPQTRWHVSHRQTDTYQQYNAYTQTHKRITQPASCVLCCLSLYPASTP